MKIVITLEVPDGTTIADLEASQDAPQVRSTPETPGLEQYRVRGLPSDEARAFADLENEPVGAFPPIGAADAQRTEQAQRRAQPLSTRDLLTRAENADKVPAAAAWAKKHYGTGSFRNLSDEQRGAVAAALGL